MFDKMTDSNLNGIAIGALIASAVAGIGGGLAKFELGQRNNKRATEAVLDKLTDETITDKVNTALLNLMKGK